MEGMQVCRRISGLRRHPHINELELNTPAFHRELLDQATSAARISAQSVLSMWLPEEMVAKVVALIRNE